MAKVYALFPLSTALYLLARAFKSLHNTQDFSPEHMLKIPLPFNHGENYNFWPLSLYEAEQRANIKDLVLFVM
jgi:hypothetical protein